MYLRYLFLSPMLPQTRGHKKASGLFLLSLISLMSGNIAQACGQMRAPRAPFMTDMRGGSPQNIALIEAHLCRLYALLMSPHHFRRLSPYEKQFYLRQYNGLVDRLIASCGTARGWYYLRYPAVSYSMNGARGCPIPMSRMRGLSNGYGRPSMAPIYYSGSQNQAVLAQPPFVNSMSMNTPSMQGRGLGPTAYRAADYDGYYTTPPVSIQTHTYYDPRTVRAVEGYWDNSADPRDVDVRMIPRVAY